MIALFGGSFDPFHKGHYNLIVEAKKQLKLTKLIIIPTGINPWKNENKTNNHHRLSMLQEIVSTLDNVEISTVEMDCNEISYTFNTIVKFRTMYPNEKIYYIIGMDQVEKFHLWKEAKKISELVQLVTFDRVGYVVNENIITYNIQKLNIEAVDYSSSAIRFGDFDGLYDCTKKYITHHNLYLETRLNKYMSNERLNHTLSVARLAVQIAQNNGINEHFAYLAAMLHDVAKEMDYDKAYEIMNQYYAEYIELPKAVWHQFLSEYIAKKDFLIENNEVLLAIRNHTTASLDMDKLSMCIYVADKYEPLRDFDSTNEIELCIHDVEQGFKQCLIDTLDYTSTKGIILAESFYKIYDKYIKGE